jgi:hypothetical protein
MHDSPEEQRIIDAEHLRLLRLGYFVSAGTTACFALIGLLYAAMGIAIGTMSHHFPQPPSQSGPPPEVFGWIFGAIGLGFTLIAGTVAVLKLRVARCLRLRQSHGFCVVIAVISCLEIPYGTALGVFSFLVLTRPAVKELFFRGTQPTDQPAGP